MTANDGLPCKRCGTSEWYTGGSCKACRLEWTRQWKKNNPDKVAEQRRKWKQGRPEKEAERKRQWRRANQEKDAERKRRYHQANQQKEVERSRRWREANQERAAEYNRQYLRANPEKSSAKQNRRRTRETKAGGSYTADEFKALCNHYGNKCLRCGKENVKLTADHVLPVARGGSSDISNIQPLCKSCNSAKNARHIDYRPDAGPLRWLQAKLFG